MVTINGEHGQTAKNNWCKIVREEWQTTSDLHDVVHSHVSHETRTKVKNKIRLEVIWDSSYSPGLSSCDFYTFRLLKKALHFHWDNGGEEAVQDFLKNQPRSSYIESVKLLHK
ncbi:hypothetical protein TNCV_2125271 [Trichonephila clavipes]|nr:hypothetical protein TNCV_2125271 [Trichonephila clavipes]